MRSSPPFKRKLSQLVHDEPQAAPFDEGHQHVNPVGRDDLFLEFREHLRLMHSPGEKRALCDGGLRALYVRRGFSYSQPRIGFPQKRKKLLCPPVNAQRGKVSFFRCILNESNDLVGQPDLGRNIPAVVQHVIQALLNHICQILRQHLGGFRLVNGRNRLASLRNLRKFAGQGVIDDLFV